MKRNICKVLIPGWLIATSLVAIGQDPAANTDDPAVEIGDGTAEIAAASQSYVAAYNARDVAKLVSHWAPKGIYISRTSGDQVVGREAMTEEFTAVFAAENLPTLAAITESIEFISPNVALERGTATVTHAEDDVVETDYRVVYIKRDGAWLIDRVTEDEIIVRPSHYDQLKDLEWLVGEWVDAGEGFTIDVTCKWTENQNYLSRTYTVSSEDGAASSGLQIIGWDAKQKLIRSWLFDSEGGFINGTWTKRDDRWVVQSVATLADGGTGSFTSVFRPTEDGNYTWQKINRVVEGSILPNIDEIIVQRK
jgi:uncharacterized protein (TIGR02246 family)